MEKIRQKPIEKIKTFIIAFLTVTMLLLSGIYIGGSQFSSRSAAINALPMPDGAVPVGNDPPNSESVYEKGLLALSFAAIRYAGSGGGTYGYEAAASDLAEFASESVHKCLSSPAVLSQVGIAEFENALNSDKYIYLSLVKSLPYQIVYALTGEYEAAAGSPSAINVKCMLLSFDDYKKTTLYLRSGDECYAAVSEHSVNVSELAAMANDSRLNEFEITESGIALSNASPHTQRIALSEGKAPAEKQLFDLLALLDYNDIDMQPRSDGMVNLVEPHGTVHLDDKQLLFKAASDSGLVLSDFLENAKNELDIDMYDVLLASVSLLEEMCAAYPEMTGGTFMPYISGFYHDNEMYTVEFGLSDGYIPIAGEAYPYLARFSVLAGRFNSIDLRFIGAERVGYTSSLFSSAWEYRYAAKTNSIKSFGLRFKIDSLPEEELDARWYFTGESLPFTDEEVGK